MSDLAAPMLFTSLTTAAGFASLALTPIPPVQTFGLFVAFGVMAAWFWTVTFIPAYVMLIPESKLADFGRKPAGEEDESTEGMLGRVLNRLSYRHARGIVLATLGVVAVAGWGISRININDNPTRWFEPDHPIRVADRVLNSHFGGTYDAYLRVEHETPKYTPEAFATRLTSAAERRAEAVQVAFRRVAAAASGRTAGDALAPPADDRRRPR